ncbi:MAG: metallophosphoesterase [Deltaproteobacteria bacterium]|nr:metallophosphoesterase [Deltaproteobacteria bacterium]MBW2532176.1 metallophosphoesterase [Deltaproteobacteria bacterium]
MPSPTMLYRAPCLLLAAAGLLTGCADPIAVTSESAAHTEVQTRYPAADRVLALGDVHGDLAAMREALQIGGVIDESDHWIGGETVVVQTGDLLDRGDDEQAIIDTLERLRAEANAAGGAVHVVQGNHELMNIDLDFRYVTPGGFADFEDAPCVDPQAPAVAGFQPHERARASAFMPGGSYAVKLARNPVVVVVGDTVFTHGGVLPGDADDVEQINHDVAEWLLGNDDDGRRVIEDGDSPVWSRHYCDDPSWSDCRKLERALAELGASRMVLGHSTHSTITSECEDRVYCIDTGMAAHYGGTTEVLELTAAGATVLY